MEPEKISSFLRISKKENHLPNAQKSKELYHEIIKNHVEDEVLKQIFKRSLQMADLWIANHVSRKLKQSISSSQGFIQTLPLIRSPENIFFAEQILKQNLLDPTQIQTILQFSRSVYRSFRPEFPNKSPYYKTKYALFLPSNSRKLRRLILENKEKFTVCLANSNICQIERRIFGIPKKNFLRSLNLGFFNEIGKDFQFCFLGDGNKLTTEQNIESVIDDKYQTIHQAAQNLLFDRTPEEKKVATNYATTFWSNPPHPRQSWLLRPDLLLKHRIISNSDAALLMEAILDPKIDISLTFLKKEQELKKIFEGMWDQMKLDSNWHPASLSKNTNIESFSQNLRRTLGDERMKDLTESLSRISIELESLSLKRQVAPSQKGYAPRACKNKI